MGRWSLVTASIVRINDRSLPSTHIQRFNNTIWTYQRSILNNAFDHVSGLKLQYETLDCIIQSQDHSPTLVSPRGPDQ